MGLDRQGGTFFLWQGIHTRFFVVCAAFEVVVVGGFVEVNVTVSVFFKLKRPEFNNTMYVICTYKHVMYMYIFMYSKVQPNRQRTTNFSDKERLLLL